jgi:hypothetical protein
MSRAFLACFVRFRERLVFEGGGHAPSAVAGNKKPQGGSFL